MLTYDAFRNTDPPALTALWRSRTGQPGLLQPISLDLLEQLVFAKLYFDYAGLIVARNDGQPVGFAHAGFGPSSDRNWVSTESGVSCVVVTRPDCPEDEVADGLLDRCEKYLGDRGAKVLYGGGATPLDPFYLGLYGGSELPGILDSDAVARRAMAARGYQEIERTVLLQRELCGFEPPVDRRQMLARRQTAINVTTDAPTPTWWEACTLGAFDLTRFELTPRGGGPALASATFRSLEPSAAQCVSRGVGLMTLSVDPEYRRRGLATFLLGEAFRHFVRLGIVHVEVQAREAETCALGTFRRLGFQDAGAGGVWRKN
ncbi:MAG: GNAT family N-acetyltransferase [Planctomycetaceae bacterium]|nr:GNAT family N-acetyltransferase [Planctomycetaceae bacterium]